MLLLIHDTEQCFNLNCCLAFFIQLFVVANMTIPKVIIKADKFLFYSIYFETLKNFYQSRKQMTII